MLVDFKEPVWLQWNPTGRGAGSLEQGQQAAVLEPRLLRALWTWHRLELLSDHRTWISEGWLRWTYDTGAATTFPLDAKTGTESQANECSHITVSGELISDRGGLRVQGTTECGLE